MEKGKIYELVCGYVDESCMIKEELAIKNEFAEGTECYQLYEQVYQANQKICERLEEDECQEVEIIINNMFDIMRIIALRMYDYGKGICDE